MQRNTLKRWSPIIIGWGITILLILVTDSLKYIRPTITYFMEADPNLSYPYQSRVKYAETSF